MPAILWFVLVHYIWRPFLPLAQLIVIFYPGVLVFWLILHTKIERWRKVGKGAYWIAAIGWPLTAGPLIYFRATLFQVQFPSLPPPGPGLILLGLVVLAAGLTVATKASRIIPLRTLAGLPELEPQKNPQLLLKSGIYSQTRNPVYLAHWLVILAASLISGYAANWMLFAADCLVLPLMIRAEERELLVRYGTEFADYMVRVPRFIPKWT